MLPLVNDELRRLAAARMKNEATENALQPTALVHEAYLRDLSPNRFTLVDVLACVALPETVGKKSR